MSDEHLEAIIAKRYKSMSPEKRVVEIRKLIRQSESSRKFFQEHFPDLYQEACSPNG